MSCAELVDVIEAVAAGDQVPSPRLTAHLASCRSCRAALDEARRLDVLLRARPAPAAPPDFTRRTMARIRRAKWRSEQVLDWGFNLTLATAGALVIAVLWTVAWRSGFATVSTTAWELFVTETGTFARRVAPSLPIYAAATTLVALALGVWWWAERDVAV